MFFGQTEMEYLGFRVTHYGVKPINRNIEAITNMNPPTSRKQLWQFIGVVNCYRAMCPRKSHTLAPLTIMSPNKRKFKRTKIEQDVFDKIKQIVTHDNLLTYPDFNKKFKIHTNARKFQFGAVISHKGKTIAFYNRKITVAHKRYTVT